MDIKDIIYQAIQTANGKDKFENGVINLAGYGFVFVNIQLILENFELNYSSGLCRIGASRNLLKTWDSTGIDVLGKFNANRYNDLLYVGSVSTLVPSIKFGGNEQLFEVGMFIKTPEGKLFPATLYWSQGGLTIGCWQKKMLGKFIGLKLRKHNIELDYLSFSETEKEHLVDAIELALQRVPISDFEGEFWDENGGTRMGVKSGCPFIEDIPIEEDIYYALAYYDGEFMNIMHDCASSEEIDKFNNLVRVKRDQNFQSKILLNFNRYLIERCYKELVSKAKEIGSRYAFQALGIFLMENGAKMTDEIRRLILENSRWRDERNKNLSRQEKIKRRKDLINFQAKILEYKEGNMVFISYM
jgi:hypothetical protein